MKWYCEKCATIHDDNELCSKIKLQLKNNKNLLGEAANFITVAGEYNLITSNNMNKILEPISNLLNSNLTYEGTYQLARDIQVFKRLNEESFVRCGTFSSPEAAQEYLQNTNLQALTSKITGASQEVDWLLSEKGKLSSIFNDSILFNGNAAGVDGQTVNKITRNTTRVTVKASINPMTKNSTGVKDIQ